MPERRRHSRAVVKAKIAGFRAQERRRYIRPRSRRHRRWRRGRHAEAEEDSHQLLRKAFWSGTMAGQKTKE